MTTTIQCGDIIEHKRNKRTYRVEYVNVTKGTVRCVRVTVNAAGQLVLVRARSCPCARGHTAPRVRATLLRHRGAIRLCPVDRHQVTRNINQTETTS